VGLRDQVDDGARKLRELTAADVRQALATMAAGYSTAAVTMGHLALKRAIRHAEANDLVARNVAALAGTPKGQEGRPSKSLTPDQAVAVITAAATLPVIELRIGLKDVRRAAALMHAYIVLSLLAGIRAEEARALYWAHVDLDRDPAASPPVPRHVAVWRSVRAHGETKTERSRRTLGLPQLAVQALRALLDSQAGERLLAGERWQDTGLVFTIQPIPQATTQRDHSSAPTSSDRLNMSGRRRVGRTAEGVLIIQLWRIGRLCAAPAPELDDNWAVRHVALPISTRSRGAGPRYHGHDRTVRRDITLLTA